MTGICVMEILIAEGEQMGIYQAGMSKEIIRKPFKEWLQYK